MEVRPVNGNLYAFDVIERGGTVPTLEGSMILMGKSIRVVEGNTPREALIRLQSSPGYVTRWNNSNESQRRDCFKKGIVPFRLESLVPYLITPCPAGLRHVTNQGEIYCGDGKNGSPFEDFHDPCYICGGLPCYDGVEEDEPDGIMAKNNKLFI